MIINKDPSEDTLLTLIAIVIIIRIQVAPIRPRVIFVVVAAETEAGITSSGHRGNESSREG